MYHIAEENRIVVGLSEFVAFARRRISATIPFDENEPETNEVSLAVKKSLGIMGKEEVTLDFYSEDHNVTFHIKGYADLIENDSITLIKSITGGTRANEQSEMAQCRGEAFILAKAVADKGGYDSINISLICINEATGERTDAAETVKSHKLDSFFEKCLSVISIYAVPEIERVTKRRPSLVKIRFPYDSIREGQEEFIRRSYRTLSRGGVLFASAPTGTGKTVSALYPAIKALGDGKCDKVFYLTPKSTTAEAARDCLELFSERGAVIKAIILTSKEKCCPMGMICRESIKACNMAKMGRMAEAVMAVYNLEKTVVNISDILQISTRYAVCPHELELSYSELCDVVICDFNYVFDPTVYIRRFFTEGGKYAFLVDEAHNLIDRGREMYSAELSISDIEIASLCDKIGPCSKLRGALSEARDAYRDVLMPYLRDEMRKDQDGNDIGAAHLSYIPSDIYAITDSLKESLEEEEKVAIRAKDSDKDERLKVIRTLLYKVKKLSLSISSFDTGYRFFIFFSNNNLSFKVFCIDTGLEIQKRIEKGHSAVFFSATLTPLHYYRSVLSSDSSSEILTVDSPFTPEQLSVSIIDSISTRYSERERTIPAVCRVIAGTLSAKRGHYMVFAPSFEYAEAMYKEFSTKYPKVKSMLQHKNMSQREKEDFLVEFSKNSESYLLGFCVMGGIYAEGIDLAGDSLIGAIVVGIGMPSLSYEREAVAEYFEEKYESGKEYAYIYPGMNRVFQAAGRVIRRENDRGVIVLIDDRFKDPIYKKSIPSLWEGMQYIRDAKDLRAELDRFWSEES